MQHAHVNVNSDRVPIVCSTYNACCPCARRVRQNVGQKCRSGNDGEGKGKQEFYDEVMVRFEHVNEDFDIAKEKSNAAALLHNLLWSVRGGGLTQFSMHKNERQPELHHLMQEFQQMLQRLFQITKNRRPEHVLSALLNNQRLFCGHCSKHCTLKSKCCKATAESTPTTSRQTM